jgi:hypothetical protein
VGSRLYAVNTVFPALGAVVIGGLYLTLFALACVLTLVWGIAAGVLYAVFLCRKEQPYGQHHDLLPDRYRA